MYPFQTSWSAPQSEERLNTVFRNRNKEYGAFTIRLHHNKRMIHSFVLACSLLTLFCFFPKIYSSFFNTGESITKTPMEIVSEVIYSKEITLPQENFEEKKLANNNSNQNNKEYAPVVINKDITDSVPMIIQGKGAGNAATNPSDSTGNNTSTSSNGSNTAINKTYGWVEVMPEFPGGEEAMLLFLQKNLKYPSLARELNIQGTVYLSFIIDELGKVKNIEIKRGIGSGLEEEAMRVIQSMPAWIPGKQNGNAVSVQYNMPIKFKLN